MGRRRFFRRPIDSDHRTVNARRARSARRAAAAEAAETGAAPRPFLLPAALHLLLQRLQLAYDGLELLLQVLHALGVLGARLRWLRRLRRLGLLGRLRGARPLAP